MSRWRQNGVNGETTNDHDCLLQVQGGSNMTGTDLYVNKPHCAAAVRPW